MYCFNCGSEVLDIARFCSDCGEELTRKKGSNIIISKDKAVNFGQNNKMTGNTININQENKDEDKNYVNRKMSIRTHIKAIWLLVTGLLGMLASVLSILNSVKNDINGDILSLLSVLIEKSDVINTSLYMFSGSLVLATFGFAMKLYRYQNFSFFHLETGNNGELYITRLGGICPKCGSKLSAKLVGPKNNKKIKTICSRNKDHSWKFDPTLLDDPTENDC